MSKNQTSTDLPNATSLQVSEDGQEHYNSRGGAQTDLFGQEAPHVSLSPQQENKKEKTMNDTSGLSSLISLESANLQRSLVSRLQQLSDMDGSTIYKLTLREKVTPQQRQYYQLVASARTTKGTDSSSWPTPTHHNAKEGGYPGELTRNTIPLGAMKHMVAWATPNTMDHMKPRSPEALLRKKTRPKEIGMKFPNNLREQVDPKSQEIYASGKIPQSSTAETENTVPSQLNPRFSLWLMGYPIEWAFSGERVTPLSRKRQRKS